MTDDRRPTPHRGGVNIKTVGEAMAAVLATVAAAVLAIPLFADKTASGGVGVWAIFDYGEDVAVAALLVLQAAGLLWLTRTRLARPLARLGKAMATFSKGDHRVAVPFLDRGDEIGALARTVQAFKENDARHRRAETALRESEERLRESERRLRQAQKIARIGDFVWDEIADRLIDRSDVIAEIYQAVTDGIPTTLEDLVALVHPDDRETFTAVIAASNGSGEPYDIEYRLLGADGSVYFIHEISEPVFDENGVHVRSLGTLQDITHRKTAEWELRESEARLRAILDNSPTKIHIKDLAGRYVMVNRQAERLFGVTEAAARGHLSADIFPPAIAGAFVDHDRAVIETGAAIEQEETWSIDEGPRTYLTVKFPIRDHSGAITGVGAIGTDITERKRIEEQLLAAKERAELADRAKSEFLANMSHELRTPLNAIIGFSEMIRDNAFGPVGSPKYVEYAHDIHSSGMHLLALINDILDLSKIEAGKGDLDEREIDVARLVRSCLILVGERADSGGVTIDNRVPDDLPRLRADQRKLKQILINLLSNAIKFTSGKFTPGTAAGGGRVRIAGRIDGAGALLIEVADTGIGIAPEDIPKALAPFRQIDGDLNRRFDGTGLGLPLAKSLAELHGGGLDLKSELGVGTTVTVRFPGERIAARAAEAI